MISSQLKYMSVLIPYLFHCLILVHRPQRTHLSPASRMTKRNMLMVHKQSYFKKKHKWKLHLFAHQIGTHLVFGKYKCHLYFSRRLIVMLLQSIHHVLITVVLLVLQ